MQMYEGYLEDGKFYPLEQANIKGRHRVVVMVIDDPEQTFDKEQKGYVKAYRDFFDVVSKLDNDSVSELEKT